FRQMTARRAFVEWARVYGQSYGTSKKTLKRGLSRGRDLVLVIESHGARAIRKSFSRAVFVLILPPSLTELKRRIVRRRGMPSGVVNARLSGARREIRALSWYDYVVVNDRVSKAAKELAAIVKAERLKGLQNRILAKRLLRS